MDRNLDALSQAQVTLTDLAVRFGPRLLAATLVLVVGFVVSAWVHRAAHRALSRFDLEPPVRLLLVRIARLAVLAVFLMMALQNLGVELLPLIAGLGVAGAGIALAAQGVLGNIVAGLTIIFTKPYRVGEYIGIVGHEGAVESISLSSTILGHPDRSKVVIPNRKIVGEILHNYGRIRQLDLAVGVARDTELPRVLELVQACVHANARVLREPAPLVNVAVLGDAGPRLAVKPWVAVHDYDLARGELNEAIAAAFRSAGIGAAAPRQDIRLVGGG